MPANQALLFALGLSLATASLFFLLIVLKNPRWYVHVINFLTGLVTVGLGLSALATLASMAYVLIAIYGFRFGGIYVAAFVLALLGLVVGAPLASTALADVLERNGYQVGKRTYLTLLFVGIPVVPIAALFGAFTGVGQRIDGGRYMVLVGLAMIVAGGGVLAALMSVAVPPATLYLVVYPLVFVWICFGSWVTFRGMLRQPA